MTKSERFEYRVNPPTSFARKVRKALSLNLMLALLKRRNLLPAFLLPVVLSLGGCATMTPRDFATSKTHFELDRFFEGHNRSWGVFENGGGTPKRSFVCDSYGTRAADGSLTLDQHFRFSDGKKQKRLWHIRRVDATHWEATANDMIGVARGECVGNAFYWTYKIKAAAKNPLSVVYIRQWIYQPEGTDIVMTRLVGTKMGMPLFKVTESIHHVPDKP
jgi:hypothetical protein